MAIQESGVRLVAKGYASYMKQMRDINAAHKDAFSSAHMQTFRKEADKTNKKTKEVKKEAYGLKVAFAALGRGDVIGAITALRRSLVMLQNATVALMAIGFVARLIQFAKVSTDIAARNETLAVSLDNVGKTAGYSADQIAYAVEALKDTGITTQAARQSLLQMAQANIEWTHATKLARIAQNAAVIGNINSSEAFQRMITGIQRGEVEILKTIGLSVNFQQAYKKQAQILGKTTEELSETEKAQARVSEVMRAGEGIAGSYESAMETAGKQQGSLARHIEETQNNLGKLFLPLKAVSIELQTGFWKNMKNVTKGLSSFGYIMDEGRKAMKKLRDEAAETEDKMGPGWLAKAFGFRKEEDLGHRIGRAFHEAARIAVQASAIMAAAIGAFIIRIKLIGPALADAFEALKSGNIAAAKEAFSRIGDETASYGKIFKQTFQGMYAQVQEMWPDLFKDFDELGGVAETSLERATDAIEDNVNSLKEQQDALKQQITVLERVESIYDDYNKSLEEAAENLSKNLAKADKELAESQEKLRAKTLDKLQDLETEGAKNRQKIIEEHHEERKRDTRQLYKDLEQARRRYELSQIQSLRRFKLEEKRAIAEGDVLRVMQMREDFDLQRKEAKENYEFQQKETKNDAQEQARIQQEDLEKRLKELEVNIRERRQEILDSYNKEYNDLIQANAERKAEMQANYQEQLQDLREARDEQLRELGESLQREGEITKQGMQAIAEKIAEVFGEQGAADSLMKGWADRSSTAVAEAMEDIRAQIAAIDMEISALESGEATPRSTSGVPVGRQPYVPRRESKYGMRTGGVGVATGPALFEVEPGVQELVGFAPLGGRAKSVLDVNVGGGFDIRGADNASPGMVDAAIEEFMSDLRLAVRRISKR